jgi:hypothetical protein
VIKSNRNKRDEATKMRFFFSRITIFESCKSEKCGKLVKQDEMKKEKRKKKICTFFFCQNRKQYFRDPF